jgi:hypothetical protein
MPSGFKTSFGFVDEGLFLISLAQTYVSLNGNYFSFERPRRSCEKYHDFINL